jgi:hypothetical protein
MRSADENLGKTLHGSLAAKEDIQAEEGAYRRLQFLNGISEAEERAMATTGRLQFPEEMRSAEEKLKETLHGDRLRKVAAKTVIDTAVDELARLDKNGGRRLGRAVDVLARPDINIRSVQEERMRKVWQAGSLQPGNRRQAPVQAPPPAPPQAPVQAPPPAPPQASSTASSVTVTVAIPNPPTSVTTLYPAPAPAPACANASASDVGVMLYNTCDGAIAAKTRINWCVI